jgi:hypothetical protein
VEVQRSRAVVIVIHLCGWSGKSSVKAERRRCLDCWQPAINKSLADVTGEAKLALCTPALAHRDPSATHAQTNHCIDSRSIHRRTTARNTASDSSSLSNSLSKLARQSCSPHPDVVQHRVGRRRPASLRAAFSARQTTVVRARPTAAGHRPVRPSIFAADTPRTATSSRPPRYLAPLRQPEPRPVAGATWPKSRLLNPSVAATHDLLVACFGPVAWPHPHRPSFPPASFSPAPACLAPSPQHHFRPIAPCIAISPRAALRLVSRPLATPAPPRLCAARKTALPIPRWLGLRSPPSPARTIPLLVVESSRAR